MKDKKFLWRKGNFFWNKNNLLSMLFNCQQRDWWKKAMFCANANTKQSQTSRMNNHLFLHLQQYDREKTQVQFRTTGWNLPEHFLLVTWRSKSTFNTASLHRGQNLNLSFPSHSVRRCSLKLQISTTWNEK